jgi:hypothetical protein
MDFNVEPYYDDFEATNGAKDQNYMRILFRPGYAVQARELTQIQSILQNQLKNFGDHIFQDGSPVFGGQITLDTKTKYLKLQTTYNGVDVEATDFANTVVSNTNGTEKIRARVVAVDETQTQPTLMVRYLRGNQFPNGNVIQATTSSGTTFAQLTAADAVGTGSVASIEEGVFYVDGYFVKVSPQTIVLDPYGNTPTYRVGLEIDDSVVDESEDSNLLDPAQTSFNYQAPGAWRYQFRLNLAKRSLTSVDDNKFFELLRVENGLITKQVRYPIYSQLEETLARRTFDESGNYTVKPFGISLEANTACSNNFIINIEPGKAYVRGFEYEFAGTQKINVTKALTTNTSTDYDLSIEYGNYLYANNISGSANGLFNIAKLDVLELHCVPRANVNTVGTVGYNTSYMGTARVKNFRRDSATEYLVYLTDIRLESNTVTAASTASNANSIVFPTTYSVLNDAYANVTVRVISGGASNSSAGDVRKIVRYDGASRTAFTDLNFTNAIGSGNTVSLVYSTKDIDALVEATSNKQGLNVAMDVSNSSKDITNATIISDTNRDTLLFMLPETYVANGTIVNADFNAMKVFEDRSFTSNGQLALTLSGNETYDYGSDGNFLTATAANSNLIIMVKSLGTATNVAVGDIINLTAATGPSGSGAAGVRRDSSTQLTLFTGEKGTFTADVYAKVKVNDSESATNNRRSKTIRGNAAITALRSTDSYTNGTAVTDAATVYIDSSNGFVWFSDASQINKTPGGNNSLYVSDVFKIVKIYDSGNTSFQPNVANAIDVTNRFYLDSGQTLGIYDHSKIVLKPGSNAPRGQTVVMLQYYEHSSAIRGYFDVDSYPAAQYANGSIPTFVNSDGTSYNLRDAIDFRPTREIGTAASVNSYTFVGMINSMPDTPLEMTYSYYVPRIDKLVLTTEGEFKTLTGVAGKFPLAPVDTEDAMTLFKLDIPAFTANVNSIVVTKVENKRYTMRDIGSLENRIRNIEYYTALNIAEKKATDTTILYEDNATEKEKYGIVADNFTGFNVADTLNPDFKCSLEKGTLSSYNNLTQIPLDVNTIGANTKRNSKTISLGFTEEVVVDQTTATANVSVQPYLYGVFDGQLTLTPQSDSWFSTTQAPIPISPVPVVPILSPTVPILGQLNPINFVNVPTSFGFAPNFTTIDSWFNTSFDISTPLNEGRLLRL